MRVPLKYINMAAWLNTLFYINILIMSRKGAKLNLIRVQAADKSLSFAAYQPLVLKLYQYTALRLRAFA